MVLEDGGVMVNVLVNNVDVPSSSTSIVTRPEIAEDSGRLIVSVLGVVVKFALPDTLNRTEGWEDVCVPATEMAY